MTNSQQRATSLLQHYLKFGEVADIVDSIIDAAAATPAQPAEPDALTRIADALERIANRIDKICDSGTDWNGNEYSVLRTKPLI